MPTFIVRGSMAGKAAKWKVVADTSEAARKLASAKGIDVSMIESPVEDRGQTNPGTPLHLRNAARQPSAVPKVAIIFALVGAAILAFMVAPPEYKVITIAIAVLVLLYLLWRTPYKVALARQHPSKDAILVLCAIGILIWPLWLVALVWALAVPKREPEPRFR
jgi:hypothetical protein